MFQKAKQIGRATWPALVLILAASAVSSGAIHAESIVPALHATMRTMRASLAQIGDFAKGDGEQAAALDAAIKAVTLAKSILVHSCSNIESIIVRRALAGPSSHDAASTREKS